MCFAGHQSEATRSHYGLQRVLPSEQTLLTAAPGWVGRGRPHSWKNSPKFPAPKSPRADRRPGGGIIWGKRSHLLMPPLTCVAERLASEFYGLYGQKGWPAWSDLRWLPLVPGFWFLSSKPETVFAHNLHTFACGVGRAQHNMGKTHFSRQGACSLD